MAQELTDNNFNEVVILSKKPVLVDFGAEWCGPCKLVAPIVNELSKEYEGKAVIVKVDVDKNPETANKYNILNIPTLLFFKDGKVVEKLKGFIPKSTLQSKLNNYLQP